MTEIMDTWLPKISTVIVAFFIIWVVLNNWVAGLSIGDFSAQRLQLIVARSVPITAIIMLFAVIRLYYRRMTSGIPSNFRKGVAYFVGFAFTLIIGLTYGASSVPYSYTQMVLTRAVGEACASSWIAITMVSMVCRGWLVRTKEAAVMAFVGLFQLFGVGMIGNMVLPEIGDFGIWLMRFPAVGANNAMWLTTYIALISIVGRIITGKQKLRATAR